MIVVNFAHNKNLIEISMLKRTEKEIIFDIPELKDTTIILDYLTTILKRRYNDLNKAVNDDKKQ